MLFATEKMFMQLKIFWKYGPRMKLVLLKKNPRLENNPKCVLTRKKGTRVKLAVKIKYTLKAFDNFRNKQQKCMK